MTPLLEIAPSQPRRRRPEPRALYEAILRLRRAGNRVYRAGRDTSLVNGRRVANAAIAAGGVSQHRRAAQ
jgi:hypothetical protein